MTTVENRPTLRDTMTPLGCCITAYRRWMHLPDPGGLEVALAVVAANRAPGDPAWLLLVAPPGGGKTEIIQGLGHLPYVHPAATLTEAALLSGTPKKEHQAGAKGGLLREIGDFGILLAKDFTSVLSMNRDVRASLLAALREVYDGSWTRHVGTGGGQTLHWSGKVGFVGGCTPAIDSHHAVMGSMGERFVMYRLPSVNGNDQMARAFEHIGREHEMRGELAESVRAVLDNVDQVSLIAPPDETTRKWLTACAWLAVRCRSSVERDGISREIELIPDAEAPARLGLVLLRIYNGLVAIGVSSLEARRLVVKAAFDSMPAIRRAVFDVALNETRAVATTYIAERINYPTTTTRRACEDLAAHGVLTRHPGGQGKADTWEMTGWARHQWATTFPEKSGGEQ